MTIKRVLNIEDTMTKHVAIVRALQKCGICDIDHATTAMEGLTKIELAIEEGNYYNELRGDLDGDMREMIEKVKSKAIEDTP
ncbi:MAG: hypothetical protein ACI4TK_06355 [Agathobacter sp.]